MLRFILHICSWRFHYAIKNYGAVALDDKKHHGDSLFFVKNGGDWGMFLESLKLRVL
jgi:hypothetical protein